MKKDEFLMNRHEEVRLGINYKRTDLNLKYSEITKKVISNCVNSSRKNSDKKIVFLKNHAKLTFQKFLDNKEDKEKSIQLISYLFSDLINIYYLLVCDDNNYSTFVKNMSKNAYNFYYKLKNNLFNYGRRKDLYKLNEIFKNKDIQYIEELMNSYMKERNYADKKAGKTTRD